MIAADWKHGIFPRKTSSRPRYSVTSRDASMAGGVTGRCEETLFLFFLFFFFFFFFFPAQSGLDSGGSRSRRWCARQGRRAATFALPGRTRRSAFCALDSTQERRLLGREKHAHMVARCRASQTISCHRPPSRRTLQRQPADRHKTQTPQSMWGKF